MIIPEGQHIALLVPQERSDEDLSDAKSDVLKRTINKLL